MVRYNPYSIRLQKLWRKFYNVQSKFASLCWAWFVAILGNMHACGTFPLFDFIISSHNFGNSLPSPQSFNVCGHFYLPVQFKGFRNVTFSDWSAPNMNPKSQFVTLRNDIMCLHLMTSWTGLLFCEYQGKYQSYFFLSKVTLHSDVLQAVTWAYLLRIKKQGSCRRCGASIWCVCASEELWNASCCGVGYLAMHVCWFFLFQGLSYSPEVFKL